MELPLAGVVASLLAAQVLSVLIAAWVQQNLAHFVTIPATLVFLLHASIPGASTCLAVRGILQGAAEAPFFALLGFYNLASGYLRWADDLSDDAALEKREPPSIVHGRKRMKRARQVLWVLLLVDFVVEELLGRVCQFHGVRLLGGTSADSAVTLAEYRTLSFAVGLFAAWAQAKLLELFQRRAVLLRLLGAQKTLFTGLTMLLIGALAVVQQGIITFLREVSPTPCWCCVILWLRKHGAILGVMLPLVFHGLLQPRYLGSWPVDSLVPIAVAVGAVLGSLCCRTFSALWLEKHDTLESDYRVLLLFPHMSSQARNRASAAMLLAFRKGASVTTTTAVEWATTRMARTALDYAAKLWQA